MKEVHEQNKYVYLEILRSIAVFFVIFNHTGSDGFFLFAEMPVGSFAYWIYMFISVFIKFSVPVFLAISGALLLKKRNESIGQLWKNRIAKMFFILIFYSLLYDIVCCVMEGRAFNIINFLISRYTAFSLDSVHLWYLYAYIAFLVGLPFLRVMVRELEDKHYYYMIAIALLLDLVPMIEFLFLNSGYELAYYFKNLWIVRDIVLYPCIGYYIHNKLDLKNKRKQIIWLWGACVIGVIIVCFMTHYRGQVTGVLEEVYSQVYHNSFSVLSMMAVFTTVKYVYENVEVPKVINKVIISIGKSSFGIYLLHLLVKKYITQETIIGSMVTIGINRLVATFLYCFLIMMVSYVITQILMRVPIVKKLVT